jgi:hypothetical protein
VERISPVQDDYLAKAARWAAARAGLFMDVNMRELDRPGGRDERT